MSLREGTSQRRGGGGRVKGREGNGESDEAGGRIVGEEEDERHVLVDGMREVGIDGRRRPRGLTRYQEGKWRGREYDEVGEKEAEEQHPRLQRGRETRVAGLQSSPPFVAALECWPDAWAIVARVELMGHHLCRFPILSV
jgi:hypothetical protein